MKKLIVLLPLIAGCALIFASCASEEPTATTTTTTHTETIQQAPTSTSTTVTRQSTGGY